MKIYQILPLTAIFCFLIQSCSFQSQEDQLAPIPQTYQSTIKTCNCSDNKNDDYRIEATINGEKLCFNRKRRPILADWWITGDFARKMLITPKILIGRLNADSTLLMRIQYNSPRLDHIILPHKIDKGNVQYCESVYIELVNIKPYQSCQGCPVDDSYYTALSSVGNLTVSILSFKNNVIEGTFAGDFGNRGAVKFRVTDGYFKTQLEEYIQKDTYAKMPDPPSP